MKLGDSNVHLYGVSIFQGNNNKQINNLKNQTVWKQKEKIMFYQM